MRGLCGWFSGREGDLDAQTLLRMVAAGGGGAANPETKATPAGGLAVFGVAARPRIIEADGWLLAIVGHPRLRDHGNRAFDPVELAATLRDGAREALSRLGGDFALAAWDTRRRRGLLAVDRIGVHQLVYVRTGESLAFASTLDMLRASPGVSTSLSPQVIFDYLYYHVCPGPQTVFAGLHRLPAGHCIEFGESLDTQPVAYWSMHFREEPGASLTTLKQEFVSLLRTGVKEAAEGALCGAFLSGGTDSSTITGMLARTGDAPAQTFSIGFDVKGYDEMEYARIAARHFGCEQHEYYVTPADVVAALPRIAAAYDQPFGNASAIPTYYCAKFAREHGVERLLAGDGGDELFGGNERYGKQHLLSVYHRIPGALRKALVEPLLLSVPGMRHVPLARKLRSYVEQACPPMPDRYESNNLLLHLGMANVFAPEFLSSIDAAHPHQLMLETHAPYADASLINQMLAIDLRFVLADGDLPKVTRMCELAGVDVAFPMLDERLVEFSQRLPADLKLRGTQLRWFFKQALLDFLPPQVITKEKHGFGLPVGTWLLEHRPLFDLAADSIGLLRNRGIVQPRFLDELLGPRLREHPAYFGTMVWVLMMLGLWLDSRKL